MNPLRKQRLYALIAILLGSILATFLVTSALSENMNLFYSPTEIKNAEISEDILIRAGGMVKEGSINRDINTLEVTFTVTDYQNELEISYIGILPDLFAENAGVVVRGRLNKDGSFDALEVLAKHDENYMPPEIANLLSVLCFFAGIIPLFGIYFRNQALHFSCKRISLLLFSLVSLSFLCLVYSFLIDDFSVAYVAQNSNLNLPFYFKFAATWGAHEGSLILWIFAMNAWLLGFIYLTKSDDESFSLVTFSIACQVMFAFSLFTLFTSNPFERILPRPPINGADLNPSLQDIAFTVHPPLLYFGYSGLLIPFAIAVSAMIFQKETKEWAASARPWALLSCSFLTLGIALGSWWAYYELGWGGWWFWDPVENAAFVPWLLSVALFHSLITSQTKGLFGKWSVLLSIFAFATSLLGTFLVRSGILTSVHAFALDPERGLFILGILAFFIIGSLGIYSLRDFSKPTTEKYEVTSKEFGFLLNNLLLVILAVAILFGTIFPLIYEAITDGRQISVGAPYFEAILFPFAILLGILQGFALYLSWGSTKSFTFLQRILIESVSIFTLLMIFIYIVFSSLIFHLS